MPKKNAGKNNELEVLNQRVGELEALWKRALADYQNLEKRMVGERTRFVKLANVGLLDKFLPILDDLTLANQHLSDKGVEMVIKQFYSVLDSEGVKEIKAKGEEFDPETMDCVEMVPGKANLVVEVTKNGFKSDDTIIRPAQVKVGSGVEKQ